MLSNMGVSVQEAARQSFKKAGRRIKVSKNLRAFVSRVVRDGRVQVAFGEQVGGPVGGCVKANVRPGMSGRVIHGIAKICSRQSPSSLNLGGGGRRAAAPRGRAVRATEEYFEVV